MRATLIGIAMTVLQPVFCDLSSKRGLIHVPISKYPDDDKIWISSASSLTWYYNYNSTPSASLQRSDLEFVPMLWGASVGDSDTSFVDDVRKQLSSGTNITHILAFNEPDAATHGGSGVEPALAATTWVREIEPLRDLGVKLGAPGVTGSPRGFTWLEDFFAACRGRCTVDFIPVHWYGNFEGLASHIGQVRASYQDLDIWITEYGNPYTSLEESQDFFNTSAEYFDRLSYITRYSYFGAFRSDVSNVGPNSAMLTENGELTDIGSWYLGRPATGAVPRSQAVAASTSVMEYFLLVGLCAWILL